MSWRGMVLGLLLFVLGPSVDAQTLGRIGAGPLAIERVEPSVAATFEGIVVEPDGTPADGAVVVSSAGGRAATDSAGSYRLEVLVPVGANRVQITAVSGGGGSHLASTSVDLIVGSPLARVDPLWLSRRGPCQPSWLPTFGQKPGTNGSIHALATFDDGSGSALYAGGSFSAAGGVAAIGIAKWDGARWANLGSGLGGPSPVDVKALVVFDDGSGPALYVGGSFTTAGGVPAIGIAKWDGARWASLGSGLGGPSPVGVNALAVFDDGSGPVLCAGGVFMTAGGVAANHVAQWNGASWALLGSGMNATVYALAVFDDGSGPALCAGGLFTTAGGNPTNYIAKWGGASWAALDSGMNSTVFSLAAFDDGSGSALFAGGLFTAAGGVPAIGIAEWDGSSWAAVGSGINGSVLALTVFDDGSGPALCAGGGFMTAGGVAANNVAEWDGSSWAALGSGVNSSVLALSAFDGGSGPALYAGGASTMPSGLPVETIAGWNGASWSSLGSGLNSKVDALTVFDDGSGLGLYVGGTFTTVGGVATNYIAKWNGTSWAPLGSGIGLAIAFFGVKALAVFDDGGGPALYAGGLFGTAGGVAANSIAKWNGVSWAPLGSGMGGAPPEVRALTVFDDGSGPALYAGGLFTAAGGGAANRIAKWNGASWAALGTGMNGTVSALTVFDDGTGSALYVGGSFTTAGGVAANYIAKWDGSSWAPLGSGMSSGAFSATFVIALAVFDDGSGPALYAGGSFTTAGGLAANHIARWDGSSWAPVGSGTSGDVYALTVSDDGSGPALYVGGFFTTAGGAAANNIAKWNGSSWTALGSGMNGVVDALTVFNDRTGPALHAGGTFTTTYDSGDSYLAKWGCPDTNPPTISCPSPIVVDDRFSNGRGEDLSFTVTASDEEDPTPSLVCVPPSGSRFPPGTTLVTCTATDFSGNQATCQFTVTVHPKAREL